MRVAVSLLLLILACVPVVYSAEDVRPDGWAGMVLDTSTPEDAVRLFGPAAKDKDKMALDLPRPLSWLSDKWKQKTFRTLTYKKLREYNEVRFERRTKKSFEIVGINPLFFVLSVRSLHRDKH